MPLIIELSHEDYPTHSVARYGSDVEYFLKKEKRFSLDEFKRRTSKSRLIDLINEFGYAKLFDLKGNCVGGVMPAEELTDIETVRKIQEQNKAYGLS